MAEKKKNSAGKMVRQVVFWGIILLIVGGVFSVLKPEAPLEKMAVSEVVSKANNGEIKQIEITENNLKVTLKDEEKPSFQSVKENGSIYEQGLKTDAPVEVSVSEESGFGAILGDVLIMGLPTLALIIFFIFMMKSAGNANNSAMNFGKAKARIYGPDKKKITFDEVAGNESAKQDLWEVVDFLKAPAKYEKLGAKIPRGVLLEGAPGTGKTLMARAVAGEAEVPFFSISGSEFVEMFAGVGASRVRDLFAKAKKNAPAIIFIDEVDAVAKKRSQRGGGAHDENEQTLNQILVEMDGFENETGVIVMAATNRRDMLDPALLRPGRFDRHIQVTLPERRERLDILKVHFKNKPVDASVDLDKMAAKTAGSSGADLANIANESAIIAARLGHEKIGNQDVVEAFEKVAIGPERKSKVMNEKERESTAYHEAGHAIVGHVLPNSDPVHKITIIPRGRTGGVTWFLPPEDRNYTSIHEFKDILARGMAGRSAEKLVYGEGGITTGAGSDLKHATELARDMIMEQGMGENLQNQVFPNSDDDGFWAGASKPYSEKTAEEIDKEVAKLLKDATKRADEILAANREDLEKLKDALIEKETLDENDVAEVLKTAKLPEVAKQKA
ncbi:MAG: ATP-dependent zinc metalloprotease FtsH [Candidatus Nomurabacteria bacterium]|jgi:cell division protease FtsH|nr:ATP-dependent zinc metalloprotease FtsH [Candidatus Nomurabacteria bacterium]